MSESPLLTIAIPTYNRSAELALLLRHLEPQIAVLPQVELLIFDNASPDDTEVVVQGFLDRGLRCRYVRRPENVGPDENFLGCYWTARGRFVWILGDDDVVFDGGVARILEALALPEVDMVFLPARGFIADPAERVQANPRATAFLFRTPEAFLSAVNFRGDLALISSVILNKERAEQFAHPDYGLGRGSFLIQLGWEFTCLKHLRAGVLFDYGLLTTCEKAPSRPFDMAKVFGTNWKQQARLFLGESSGLYHSVLDQQMYAWFPQTWVAMRKLGFTSATPDPVGQVKADFHSRWTFWAFTFPILALPLVLAEVWLKLVWALRVVHRRFVFRGALFPPLNGG
jgi:glycosyltransferase involved in cell wall biosynthesis